MCCRKLRRESGRFVKAAGWELDYIRVLEGNRPYNPINGATRIVTPVVARCGMIS